MLLSLKGVAVAAFSLALLLVLFFWLVPTRQGWDGLSDFLLRAAFITFLTTLSLVCSSLSLYLHTPRPLWLWAIALLSAVPALAGLFYAALILRKLL